jgi:hypothetical protein
MGIANGERAHMLVGFANYGVSILVFVKNVINAGKGL